MALAVNALTTLANVKAASAVAVTDARLETLIGAVSQAIENFTGRPLGFATVSTTSPDLYRGSGTSELFLRRMPILSITRVRVDGAAITDYWRSAQHDEIGCLMRGAQNAESSWQMAVGVWPDLTGDLCYRDDARSWNVDVCGTFGYVLPQYGSTVNVTHNPAGAARTLPYPIEEACIREVLRRASRPVPGVKREKTPGGWEVEYFGESGAGGFLEETVRDLNPYCRPGRWFA